MSLSGQTKSTTTTMTNTSKNSVTLYGMQKAGTGWNYDDPYITYDGEFDKDGRKVLYDSIGSAITLTSLTKNNV